MTRLKWYEKRKQTNEIQLPGWMAKKEEEEIKKNTSTSHNRNHNVVTAMQYCLAKKAYERLKAKYINVDNNSNKQLTMRLKEGQMQRIHHSVYGVKIKEIERIIDKKTYTHKHTCNSSYSITARKCISKNG